MEKKTTFATDIFPWKAIDDDDFVCVLGNYTLRVEQMDNRHWWWRVYYKDDALPEQTNEFSNSKYRAIGNAEGMYLGHFNKYRKNNCRMPEKRDSA